MLQLIRVKDFDAAIDEANNTRFGLAASLIGGSPEMYDKFWANVRAGVINWNKPTNGAPSNAPFGGIGLSRQPPPERLLCRRLLRLSGDQQRGRPAARRHRRRVARPEHAGRLSATLTAWIALAARRVQAADEKQQMDRHGPRPRPVQRRPLRLPSRTSQAGQRETAAPATPELEAPGTED